MQEPRFGQFTSHSHEATSLQRRDSLLKADEAARDHSAHPGLPHENKPLLETEGLHGAGAGIGLGSGVGGFADNVSVCCYLVNIDVHSNIFVRMRISPPS